MSKRTDAAKALQWLERIEAYEQSGLSRRAWCAQTGISVNSDTATIMAGSAGCASGLRAGLIRNLYYCD